MGREVNRRNDFYTMVSHWTLKDHFNPGIKAEVIWDMLLSEYIPEIVSYCEEPEKEGCEGYRILAKEFPLRAGNKKDSLANAKADYLVEGPDFLYLVELKTTGSSFDNEQFQRYCSYLEKNGAGEMWDFYLRVIDENIKTSYFEGKRREDYSREKYLTHVKYQEQVKGILGREDFDPGNSSPGQTDRTQNGTGFKSKKEFMEELRNCAEKKKKKPVKLLYLMLSLKEGGEQDTDLPKGLSKESLGIYQEKKDFVRFKELNGLLTEDFEEKMRLEDTTWELLRKMIGSVSAMDISNAFLS